MKKKIAVGVLILLAWLPLIAAATPGASTKLSGGPQFTARADDDAKATADDQSDDAAGSVLNSLEKLDGSMVDHLRALRDAASHRPESLRLENVPELEEALALMRKKLNEVERMANDVLQLADAVGLEGATTRGELAELRDLYAQLADECRRALAGVGNESDPAAKRVVELWERELRAHETNVKLIENSAEVITTIVMENQRSVRAVRLLSPTFPRLRKSVDGLERLGKVINDVEAFRKSAATILSEIDALLSHYESVAETAGSAIDRLVPPTPKRNMS